MTDKPKSFNNRVTKADLLLAGWHSIYEGEIDKEYWVHPKVFGGHDLKTAKKLQRILANNVFEGDWRLHDYPTR